MHDTVTVYFKFLSRGFDVSSVLASFDIFGHNFTIRWYGAIIAFGFLLAVLFGGRLAYKWKVNLDHMIDVLIFGTLAGVVGARLYYCVFHWDYYGAHPAEIIRIWEGGLGIYGGLIFGLIAAFFVCRYHKINYFNLLDMGAMSFLIGQGIGRWGNFANQEAFGTNTQMPWGMWSQKVADYIKSNTAFFEEKSITMQAGTFDDPAWVHPTFLYESIVCLVGFGVLFLVLKKFRKFSGQMMLCYCVWYGTGRAIIEGFRTDSLYIPGTVIRVSQLLSALLAAAALVALIVLYVRYTKHPKPIEGIGFFTGKAAKEAAEEAEIRAREEEDARKSIAEIIEEREKKEQNLKALGEEDEFELGVLADEAKPKPRKSPVEDTSTPSIPPEKLAVIEEILKEKAYSPDDSDFKESDGNK